MKLLIVNCGSSSIKFQLIDMPGFHLLAGGYLERVGKIDGIVNFNVNGEKTKQVIPIRDHTEGIQYILDKLFSGPDKVCSIEDVKGIGHRIVHGGDRLNESVVIDDEVVRYLDDISDLAPLHNPAHLAGIAACGKLLPDLPQVAVFDNGYHSSLSEHVYKYAIPNKYYEKYNIRKFGFHGIAFRSIAGQLRNLGMSTTDKKAVFLMLGSGNTAAAVLNGRSVEVSTGFTPLEGLIQSTRSGDTDPAVFTYIMKKEGLNPEQMEYIANKESGWLGMSDISDDLREILQAAAEGNNLALVTIDSIVHRIKKYVGAYAAVLGGVDVIAFGGGVGENAWQIREKVLKGLEFLGVELDERKNRGLKGQGIISSSNSRVQVAVVNVDEEKIIAEDTYSLIKNL